MARYSSITPEGTSDLLFNECVARRRVEDKVIGFFKQRGYSEVITPSLEFYDVFANEFSAIPQEMMYKFIDSKGRILVLRPDNTMPIARLASTRLKSFEPPLRLYYNQKVYRVSPAMSGRQDELTQCGIELLGASGKKSDLEITATAVMTLNAASPLEFCLELGHVGFYKSIIDGLPFESKVIEQIREYIESKNYAALNASLENYKQNPCCRALMALPSLFGGEEVFDLALSVAPNGKSVAVIEYLKELYTDLCELGLRDKIMIDLGLVSQIDYYSGVVFRGFMQGSGETMLSGGRYDSLLSAFGSSWQAIGFAVNTDAIARATDIGKEPNKTALIYYEPGFFQKAFRYWEDMADLGIISEMSVFNTLEETRTYAAKKGIRRIDVVGGEIRTITL